jgi:hypothetical protein
MPKRQQATELVAFGFDSPNCVKCPASSEKHSKISVRIRKDDFAKLGSNASTGTSQIYVRVPEQEALSVDIGSCINIKSKKCELSFEVSSIHVLTSIVSQTRFIRTAVLSGRFA